MAKTGWIKKSAKSRLGHCIRTNDEVSLNKNQVQYEDNVCAEHKPKKKKLKKEDIQKYGTPEEIKLLEMETGDLSDMFADDFEISLGDEQDQSDIPEERPIKDGQEAMDAAEAVEVPITLLIDIYEALVDSNASEDIIEKLGTYVGGPGFFGEDEDPIEEVGAENETI